MDTAEALQPLACARIWTPEIVTNVKRFLSPNFIACVLRLVDKESSQQLGGNTLVRLSLPTPAHVFKRRWGTADAFRGLTWEQREKLICLTAASGCGANLEVAIDNAGLALDDPMLEAAAGAGQLEACELLRARGCPWVDALVAAALGGHWVVCEWLLASYCPFTQDAVNAAARGGHKGLLQWLLQQLQHGGGTVDTAALLEAAAYGLDLPALQQLYQQELPAGSQQQQQQQQGGGGGGGGGQAPGQALDPSQQKGVLAAAAGSPTSDWQAKVEWLEELGYPRAARVGIVSACWSWPAGGMLGRVQWLCDRGYTLNCGFASAAAKAGDLEALRFLVEQAGVVLADTPSWRLCVARSGHLAVLQYLHARIRPVPASLVASMALRAGHLPVVVWAMEALGVTPGTQPDLLNSAACSGSVEIIAWLQERGWGWARSTLSCAAASGCEETLEWLVERGCPWPDDGQPYVWAASGGDLAIIRCLHRLGCSWGNNQLLVECVRSAAPVAALRLLVELGCPEQDWETAELEAGEQRPNVYRIELLEWLGKERQRRQWAGG